MRARAECPVRPLLRLAERGFYRPLWSQRILDETKLALRAVHPEIDPVRLDSRVTKMAAAFDDAAIERWEPASAGLDLPDPDDRHVLAAAIVGNAQALVTFNLKDFPTASLSGLAVQPVHPDEFLLDQLDLYPALAVQVLQEQAADLINPPSDLAGVLNRLARRGVPRFADAVRLLAPDGT
ncbi:MAG: PIN domain-containing protein [Acidothermaceae bacterium]